MNLDIKLVTTTDAARLLGVHTSTVREWVRLGRIPSYRLGQRFVRLDWDELIRFLATADHNRDGKEVPTQQEVTDAS